MWVRAPLLPVLVTGLTGTVSSRTVLGSGMTQALAHFEQDLDFVGPVSPLQAVVLELMICSRWSSV